MELTKNLRMSFRRLEGWLFQKPWVYGLAAFVLCWILSVVPILAGHSMNADWQRASFVIDPGNWLYAAFWKWRHRNDVP